MSLLESFGKALVILLEAFLGKRKGQEEAHNNFLNEYTKANCNHRLVEYWFSVHRMALRKVPGYWFYHDLIRPI